MSKQKLLAVCCVAICVFAIYIKMVHNAHSSWRFVATNCAFRVYVQLFKALTCIGIVTSKHSCSLELQLMDDIFRRFVKPDYTNHRLSTAKTLLTQTRAGRKAFLAINLQPIWDKQQTHLEYETIANTKVLWVNKASIRNGLIISLHGGAYISGSAASCLPYLIPLTSYTYFAGLSINYSLSPEVQLPQQVHEVFNIYQYLLNEMNINPKDIAIVGDSAGGSLLVLFIQTLIEHEEYQHKLPLCGVTLSSWDVPSNGDSYKRNRESDSLMDDMTGRVWGHFAVGNIDIEGNILESDEKMFDKKMNDNPQASYLHKDNLHKFKKFPPLFLSASEYECVLADSVRIKTEMDKYVENGGAECVLHVTKSTGIHVLEDFYAHGIIEAEILIQKESEWILRQQEKARLSLKKM